MHTVKSLGIFAVGCLTGGLAVRTYFKKKYEKISEEEIASMRDYIQKKEKELKEKKESSYNNYKTLESDSVAKSVYFNYQKPADEDEIVDYEEYRNERMEEMAEKEHPEDDIPESPYRISADDFINNEVFDKETLTFYEEDAALTDEQDQIVEISNTIGQDAYTYFLDADVDEMFVRNPKLSIDFEIVRSLGSYLETVVGEVNDE